MPYTIGEVARMMNIAPSTLRYYEKEGLLSLGVRASNGQRTYTDDDIATLSIIEYLKFCASFVTMLSSVRFARSALPMPVNTEKTNRSRVWHRR